MHHFEYHGDELRCEGVALHDIARAVGTPAYVYSKATLTRHWSVFDQAFSGVRHLVCFAVKSCSNLSILKLFAALGSGFDAVSGGELFRLQRVGVDPQKVIYGGVGKTEAELRMALQWGVRMLNVESAAELALCNEVAKTLGKRAPVALRINPDVDPKTHPYIATGLRTSKFGIPLAEARSLYETAKRLPYVEVVGVDCHIGSQLVAIEPLLQALEHLLSLVDELQAAGHVLRYLDLGGGLGIPYSTESPPHPTEYGQRIVEAMRGRDLEVLLEPGRVIVGNAAVMLTRVLYQKSNEDKRFIVVDAGMNDAMRPALYGAHHELLPALRRRDAASVRADVVGPVCETGDFLAKDRALQQPEPGDLLALMSAGAYGFVMASNYNSRPRPAEVLVDGHEFRVIRERETLDDLIRGECV
jgi:diaminopimelate decarboxylase